MQAHLIDISNVLVIGSEGYWTKSCYRSKTKGILS